MTEYEKNTEVFYKELFGLCRPDKLLEIAKKGIFLYEPLFRYEAIREHEYVIYISALTKQYFMIFNEKQYETFIKNINNVMTFNIYVELSRFDYCSLVIINDFFLNRLLQETKEFLLETVISSYDSNYLLRFLHQFKKVSDPLFTLFNKKANTTFFDFINFFYFGIDSRLFSWEPTTMDQLDRSHFEEMANIIGKFGYDIQMLNYLVKQLKQYHHVLPITKTTIFRVPLTFPLTTLQYYTDKIYEPNVMKFQHDHPYIETFFNTVFTDTYFNLTHHHGGKLFFSRLKSSPMLTRYGLNNIENISGNYHLQNQEEYEIQQELLGISQRLDTMELTEPEEDPMDDEEDLIQLLNNDEKLNQLLMDPDSIFSLQQDMDRLSNNKTLKLNLLYVCYLIAIIHQKSNIFIIYLLTKILNETLMVQYRKNKLIIYCDSNCESDMKLCQILNSIPHDLFRSYFLFKEKMV